MSLSGLASTLQDIIYDMRLSSKKNLEHGSPFCPFEDMPRPAGITVAYVTESQLQSMPARINATRPLRVYATTTRFGFPNLVESTSRHFLSLVHLTGISGFPDDFAFASATMHRKLVRQREAYLTPAAETVRVTVF